MIIRKKDTTIHPAHTYKEDLDQPKHPKIAVRDF